MSPVVLMLLILLVSSHACTARRLSLTKKDTVKYFLPKEGTHRSMLVNHVEEAINPSEIDLIPEDFDEIDYVKAKSVPPSGPSHHHNIAPTPSGPDQAPNWVN